MKAILDSPARSLLAGIAVAAALLGVWLVAVGADPLGFVSFLLRYVHVFTAMLWVGMIWFVNFIQHQAVVGADDAGRATLMRAVVPRVAHLFRHASHATILSGLLLLVTSGYLFDRLMFTTAVYVPPPRALMLWAGVAGGLAMWGLVHLVIWKNLKLVLDPATAGEAKAAAREQVRIFARINLILSIPVTLAMMAAAHLY